MAEFTLEEMYAEPTAKPKPVVDPRLVQTLAPKDQRSLNVSEANRRAEEQQKIAEEKRATARKIEEENRATAKKIAEENRAASRKLEEEKIKPIPDKINSSVLANHQAINKLDDALDLLESNKDAIGLKGNLGQFLLNKLDPKGIDTRAAIADIGSMVLHDRSGANVTVGESPRLLPFIPTPSDDYNAAKGKLARMRKYVSEEQDAIKATYSKEQGFKDFAPLPQRIGINKPPVGAPLEAKKARDGKWYSPDPARPGKYLQWGD
jgi:hypothetical protein